MTSKRTLIGLVLLLAACLLLTERAINSHEQMQSQAEMSGRSLLDRVFGESRAVLAERMYYRADVYYHAGIGHADHDHDHHHHDHHHHDHHQDHGHEHEHHDEADEDEVISALEEELGFTDDDPAETTPEETAHSHALCEHDDHHHHHEHKPSSKHEFNDWWSRLNRRLHPRGHRHLRGAREEKEVLPWLWAAIRIDPDNPQPYLDGAYFLGHRLEQPDKALELLSQGIERISEEVELYFAKGTYLYHLYDDHKQAFEVLGQGRRQWLEQWRRLQREESPEGVDDEEIPNSLLYFRLLGYMGRIAYDSGDLETAKAIYEEALFFAPSERMRSRLNERILDLDEK